MKTITVFDNEFNETASYTLQNHGIPYFGHTYSAQIEDTDNGRLWEDTNTFSVLNEYKPTNSPVDASFFDWVAPDGKINRYKVTNIADVSGQSASGVLPYTTFTGVNKLAYDLSGIPIDDKTWVSPTISDVANYVLANTGWVIGTIDTMGLNTDDPTNFAISSAESAQDGFNSMITSFGCEVRAYITYDKYGNMTQVVDVLKHLQPVISSNYATTLDQSTNLYTDTTVAATNQGYDPTQGQTIEYRNGLAGFERTQDWTTLYTRIQPISQSGKGIGTVNDSSPYVVDSAARDYWLGPNQPHRTLKITNEHLGNLSALKTWAQKQLKVYNHPAFTYTITTAFMSPEKMPMLGATNFIANFDVKPTLTILAEVVQVEIHDDAPTNNVIVYGEYRTLNPTTPAFIAAMKNSLANAILKAREDASSIQANILYPDGLDFAQGDISKRLILQADESSTNISAFIDSKGFDWSHLNTDGSVDGSWSKSGYLINSTTEKLGTIRGQIDGNYIMDDPEVKLDDSSWQGVGEFNAYTNGINKIIQDIQPLSGGGWITSRAPGSSETKTTYVRHNADFSYSSSMTMDNGGHGTSFGIREESGQIYILSCLKVSGGYDIIKFPYTAGAALNGSSSGVVHLISLSGYVRVNYDPINEMIGYSDNNLYYYVVDYNDALMGTNNIKYMVKMQDYGYDNSSQVFQTQFLDFPYLYWQCGDGSKPDSCQIYAVNVIHQGQEFQYVYDFQGLTPISGATIEPEGLIVRSENGIKKLYHAFNTQANSSADKVQKVFVCNIGYRAAAADVYSPTGDD